MDLCNIGKKMTLSQNVMNIEGNILHIYLLQKIKGL